MLKTEILVVDDEEAIRKLLKKAFDEEGFSILEAESAESALELIKKHPVKTIVVDMNLPGMNGMEFGRAVRRDSPNAKMYAITGMPSKFEFSDCREAGFDGYFTKPLNLKLFVKTVLGR
jgi:CheY-like chemotaxis protein